MRALYKGFSSYQYEKTKSFKVTDVELVKLDLLNHIYTRKGERLMMPTFGTRIPDIVFEPLDDIVLDDIAEDLTNVFNFDPRVKLLSLEVMPDYDTNSVIASARLRYIELNMEDNITLNLVFEDGQQ